MLQCVACVAECWEKTESCQARFPGPLGQCKSCARRTEDSVHDVHDAHAVHESKSGMVPCVGDTSFRFAKHFLNFFIQIVILKHSMLAFPLVTLVHGMFFFFVRNSQRVRVIDCCDWTSERAHYVLILLIAVTARWGTGGTGYYEVTELLK